MAHYRVTLIGSYLDQQVINTFAFRNRGAATGNETDLAQRFDSMLTGIWSTFHGAARKFNLIDVRSLDMGDALVYALDPTTKQGAEAAATHNPAEAVVVSLKSVYASRRRNGRWYVCGVPAQYLVSGRVEASAATVLAGKMAAIMALFGPNGSEPWELGVWSDPGPDKLGAPRAPLFTPTAQLRINLITGSMRTRRIGVGS